MSGEHEVSRIGIQFGEEFDGDGKTNLKVNLMINAQHAKQKVKEMTKLSEGKFHSLNFNAVFVFEGADNEQLQEIITQLTADQEQVDESVSSQRTFRNLSKIIKEYFICETHVTKDNKFLLRIQYNETLSEKILDPIQVLLESGLNELANSQENSLEANVLLNCNAADIIDKIKQGDRILVPILSQIKADLILKLHKDLSQQLDETVSAIDESLVNSPQLLFLKYFKNFDVHLNFHSAQDLPLMIRQKILPGKKCQEDSDRREADIQKDQSFLKQIIDSFGSTVSIAFFVEDFATLEINLSAPGFSTLLLQYLGFVLQSL